MSDKYFTINIRAYLDKDEPTYIGEESLYDLLSDFSCPKNLMLAVKPICVRALNIGKTMAKKCASLNFHMKYLRILWTAHFSMGLPDSFYDKK